MGEVIRFISKAERERLRLIREARAIYDGVFPPSESISEGPDDYVYPIFKAFSQVPVLGWLPLFLVKSRGFSMRRRTSV